jgi:hypothetical protein
VNDFKRIAVWVENVGGIVAWIIFHAGARRDVIPGASSYRRLIKGIDLFVVFRSESPVNCGRIRLPLLQPEKGFLTIPKPPEIGVAVFTFERKEESNI